MVSSNAAFANRGVNAMSRNTLPYPGMTPVVGSTRVPSSRTLPAFRTRVENSGVKLF